MATQSDKITKAILDASKNVQRFSTQEIEAILKERYGEDAPSRRTVRNRLKGLEDVGVLVAWGGGGRTFRMFSLSEPYRSE